MIWRKCQYYSEVLTQVARGSLSKYSKAVGIHLFKVSNGQCQDNVQICSNLTIITPERRHWLRYGIFIVTSEQLYLAHCSEVFIVDFKLVNITWNCCTKLTIENTWKHSIRSEERIRSSIRSEALLKKYSVKKLFIDIQNLKSLH